MTLPPPTGRTAPAGFQLRAFGTLMLLASVVGVGALLFVRARMATSTRHDFERQFQEALATLHAVQDLRHAMLAERCRALARRPRIHAALEDNALDLLYPSARDELADITGGEENSPGDTAAYALHAKFYRFVDARGAVIPPTGADDAGQLTTAQEAWLSRGGIPDGLQIGDWVGDGGRSIAEVMAMPILSTETGQAIAAIVLGFAPAGADENLPAGFKRGVWSGGSLYLPQISPASRADLGRLVAEATAATGRGIGSLQVRADGAPQLLFYERINPASAFPPAYEICLYPLDPLFARQRRLAWQFAGAGAVLLLGSLGASQWLARRLAAPVARLAADADLSRASQARAEAALQSTSRELQRSARFSADASHQLKTPVTVLRAGLEELLAAGSLAPQMREEVAALIHQTLRLTGIIEDLLLLSRLDAGRLQPVFTRVELNALVGSLLDDTGAQAGDSLTIETELPAGLALSGEPRYVSLVLQNLLENARKFNRPGGRIQVAAHTEAGWVVIRIGNSGRAIAPDSQEHIFERFHRGTAAADVPGHGLGLNLARELTRIHGGDLRLVRSAADWTEFEVRWRPA